MPTMRTRPLTEGRPTVNTAPPDPYAPQPAEPERKNPGLLKRRIKPLAIGVGIFFAGVIVGTQGSDSSDGGVPAAAAPTHSESTVTVTADAPEPEAVTEVVTETVTATETETVEVEVEVAAPEPDTQETVEAEEVAALAEPDEAPAASEMTVSQQNAVRSAESYLSFSAFSKTGLVDQLVYEEYTTADAEFAVNQVDVDWMEQAAKSAESYLSFTAFSRQGLIDQLIYEGFTQEQAAHGADSVGL